MKRESNEGLASIVKHLGSVRQKNCTIDLYKERECE